MAFHSALHRGIVLHRGIARGHRPWHALERSESPEGIPRRTPGQPLHSTLGRANATQKETTAHGAQLKQRPPAQHTAPRAITLPEAAPTYGRPLRPPFAEYGKAHSESAHSAAPPAGRMCPPRPVSISLTSWRATSARHPAAPRPRPAQLARRCPDRAKKLQCRAQAQRALCEGKGPAHGRAAGRFFWWGRCPRAAQRRLRNPTESRGRHCAAVLLLPVP